MAHHQIATLLFLQIAVILTAAYAAGRVAALFGQPKVVGEMIAGVALGPSLFGALLPQAHAALFPAESLPVLSSLGQLGLALFMFLVGMKFDLRMLAQRAGVTAAVALAGIVVPFGAGAALALYMMQAGGLFADSVTTLQACLFIGAAISITAFPMLARMIHEWHLTATPLGTFVLAAGSANDAVAWCILALVLASFAGDLTLALATILGGIAYAAVVLLILKPALQRLLARRDASTPLMRGALVPALALLALGAWFTDFVGVYSVFGAFLLGLAAPRGPLTAELNAKLEPLTATLLVPLFFVCSGLNTNVDLVLASPQLVSLTVAVILVACLAKGGACWLAARAAGTPGRTALAVGALMNARGMMELVLINIGLHAGLITPALFTMLVIMTLATTLLAAPLFRAAYRPQGVEARPLVDGAGFESK